MGYEDFEFVNREVGKQWSLNWDKSLARQSKERSPLSSEMSMYTPPMTPGENVAKEYVGTVAICPTTKGPSIERNFIASGNEAKNFKSEAPVSSKPVISAIETWKGDMNLLDTLYKRMDNGANRAKIVENVPTKMVSVLTNDSSKKTSPNDSKTDVEPRSKPNVMPVDKRKIMDKGINEVEILADVESVVKDYPIAENVFIDVEESTKENSNNLKDDIDIVDVSPDVRDGSIEDAFVDVKDKIVEDNSIISIDITNDANKLEDRIEPSVITFENDLQCETNVTTVQLKGLPPVMISYQLPISLSKVQDSKKPSPKVTLSEKSIMKAKRYQKFSLSRLRKKNKPTDDDSKPIESNVDVNSVRLDVKIVSDKTENSTNDSSSTEVDQLATISDTNCELMESTTGHEESLILPNTSSIEALLNDFIVNDQHNVTQCMDDDWLSSLLN